MNVDKSTLLKISELDFILNVLLKKYQQSNNKKGRKAIRKFLKAFDDFYMSAAALSNDKLKEVRCELNPDIYMMFDVKKL